MMNSETSTSTKSKVRHPAARGPKGAKGVRQAAKPPQAPKDSGAGANADSLRPIHVLVIGVAASGSAAVLLSHGTTPANIVLILLAVVAVGGATAAFYRTLWPLASDVPVTEPQMLGGRTRAALEREKTIVLRAIKELEFDRAMGKVSDADCEEMVGRLRARAVRIIRQLDAGSASYQELIEREVKARLV